VLIECVVNISEGRSRAILSELSGAAGPCLRDLHADPDHHRSVFTLAGPHPEVVDAAKALAAAAVTRLDLTAHRGVHPRLGLVDVVPFVPYARDRRPPTDLSTVVPLRDAFARWLADDLGIPGFLYGPLTGGRTRTLPDIRRHAFADLAPDVGPDRPHPTAGAAAIGARPVLVAYNVWVSSPEVARRIAAQVRSPMARTLGLAAGTRAQVSGNLIDPAAYGPAEFYDDVAAAAAAAGGTVEGAELVGLVPGVVLHAVPSARWDELGLSADASVECRLTTPG
jgi:glutamate formiminotransferase